VADVQRGQRPVVRRPERLRLRRLELRGAVEVVQERVADGGGHASSV
jgi:hypothetical protein